MKAETFNTIMKQLTDRVERCAGMLPPTTEALLGLTLQQTRDLKNFVEQEKEDMDRIIMVDFYHIVGMGNLSSQQMMKFVYKMQEYLSFRSRLKTIWANGLIDIDNLPKIPVKTKYRTLRLGPVELFSGPDGAYEVEDKDTFFADLVAEIDPEDLPCTLEGKTLHVKADRVDEFFKLVGMEGSENNLKQKAATKKTYLGIAWFEATADEYIGKAPTNIINRLKKILRKAAE